MLRFQVKTMRHFSYCLAHGDCLGYAVGMTNQIAIGLALFIVGFFLLDHFVFHLDALTVVLRKIVSTINHMAFWR